MGTMATLERLRVLTEQLSGAPPEIALNSAFPGMKEYAVPPGTCLSWNVFSTPEIGCIRCFISAGTVVPPHQRSQREWLMPYHGVLLIRLRGRVEKRLRRGELIIIEPGVVHSAMCEKDCWFVSISVPRAAEWLT